MDDDWEEEYEFTCPKCGASPVRYRECDCDDGMVWGYEEDPLWYGIDEWEECPECHGRGCFRWCPECGTDLTAPEYSEAMGAQFKALDEMYYAAQQ
jgi:transcription initiation factor IIE alpha subunit